MTESSHMVEIWGSFDPVLIPFSSFSPFSILGGPPSMCRRHVRLVQSWRPNDDDDIAYHILPHVNAEMQWKIPHAERGVTFAKKPSNSNLRARLICVVSTC